MQDASYFRALSSPALDYAIRDIRDVLACVERFDPVAEAKYLDQLACALTERNRRTGKDCCPSCHRPL